MIAGIACGNIIKQKADIMIRKLGIKSFIAAAVLLGIADSQIAQAASDNSDKFYCSIQKRAVSWDTHESCVAGCAPYGGACAPLSDSSPMPESK